MKKSMFLGLSFIALMAFGACTGSGKKSESSENAQTEQTETVAQEKAWVGTYEGLTPSASGEGVQVRLVLNEDDTYAKTETYVGKDTVLEEKGTIEWAEDAEHFALVSEAGEKSLYLLKDGNVIMLTAEGTVVEGELGDQYILRRQ